MSDPQLHIVQMNNDFTGSTRVIAECTKVLVTSFKDILVYTSGEIGLLSNLQVSKFLKIPYVFENRVLPRLYRFLIWQVRLFIKLCNNLDRGDLVLINTCLPFSAALAARIKGCKCVYYLHEDKVGSRSLTNFLFFVIRNFATGVIYVSEYLMDHCKHYRFPPGKVLYNPTVFDKCVMTKRSDQPFTVLMLSSFKSYKGVYSFVELAEMNPSLNFILVISSDDDDVNRFILDNAANINLKIFTKQSAVESFYKNASIVINLTNPEECIETFGMTVLEGFSFGLPALVPYVGGISELVIHNENGFHVDPANLLAISRTLSDIKNDNELYSRLVSSAYKRADDFSNYPILNVLTEAFGND
jgi:glycosyltransferase involved in cell wall biosynthesis